MTDLKTRLAAPQRGAAGEHLTMDYRITAPRGKCLSRGAAKFICFAKNDKERKFLLQLYKAMARGSEEFKRELALHVKMETIRRSGRSRREAQQEKPQ
jgi:hypothetical protein